MDTVTGMENIRSVSNYSEALKMEVIEAVMSRKLSKTQACSRYGIKGHSTILKWIRKYQGTKMKPGNKKQTRTTRSSDIAKLLEEKQQLEQALLKATVRVHCLETVIEEAESRYGTDFKKAYIQRS